VFAGHPQVVGQRLAVEEQTESQQRRLDDGVSAYLRSHINVHGHYTFRPPGPWRASAAAARPDAVVEV